MDKADRNTTLIIAGMLGWFSVMMITRVKAQFALAETLYYVGFGLFLLGFIAINFIPAALHDKRISGLCLAVQILGFSAVFVCCQSTDALILLVIFAGQLPFFLSQRQAVILLLVINALCFLIYYFMWDKGLNPSLIAIGLNIAFQSFSLAVAHIAVQEKASRVALEQVNAELMSTRALLEQTSRQAEREKLSRDLHDICGHQLTALLLNLEFLSKTVAAPQQESVNETKQIAKDLLGQIRDVVRQNKQSTQLDLNAAIDSLFANLPQVKAEFTQRLSAPLLSGHHAEVLLRICQEAVSNALRYGTDKHVIISLNQHDNDIEMTIENGFVKMPQPRKGMGLRNMQQRAAELHGNITVNSENNRWRLTVQIPYKEQDYD